MAGNKSASWPVAPCSYDHYAEPSRHGLMAMITTNYNDEHNVHHWRIAVTPRTTEREVQTAADAHVEAFIAISPTPYDPLTPKPARDLQPTPKPETLNRQPGTPNPEPLNP